MPTLVKHYYVGIDPGKSGGIAILQGKDVMLHPMPATEKDIWDLLSEGMYPTFDEDFTVHAVIERVQGYIGPGSEAPGRSMFNFGMGYGGLRMALIASGMPFEVVQPNVWQRKLRIPPRKPKETRDKFKNRLKAFAQQLYPKFKITLATADALLIATYCKRLNEGKL